MSGYSQRLGKDVGEVLVARDPGQVDHLLRDPVSNHVVLDINVLGARVVDHVLGDAASSDGVEDGLLAEWSSGVGWSATKKAMCQSLVSRCGQRLGEDVGEVLAPAPMLSMRAPLGVMTVSSSLRRFLKYKPSLQPLEAEMYSASVDDVDTIGCLEVIKLTMAP